MHRLNPTARLRVVRLGQPVLDVAGPADPIKAGEAVGRSVRLLGELNAVVGEHSIHLIGHALYDVRQDLSTDRLDPDPAHSHLREGYTIVTSRLDRFGRTSHKLAAPKADAF